MFRSFILLLFCAIFSTFSGFAQQFTPFLMPCVPVNKGSSVKLAPAECDALNYLLELEIDVPGKVISGSATIDLKLLKDANTSGFDLTSSLTVDSVQFESAVLGHTHSNSRLEVIWPRVMKDGESVKVTVYYHGRPEEDQSWGGFYFTGVYGFNLGVGFTADPHNYGRAWFPCFDNFTDRATYEFKIVTTKGELAQCNGSLVSRNALPGEKMEHHWKMNDPIPTYLASVAVAPYVEMVYEHRGIPVRLSALKADSSNMASSFANLPTCIDAFEQRFGEHTFERIGFNLVPFNGGAMEHATNIAYPIFGAKGDKNYETLWAHEFAHHWWGNTVTCRDQSDMWINEGWASYAEKIFLEEMYGRDAYDADVASNHLNVLRFAHLRDEDTLAISGVDHARTYGMHVYKKGADVIHSLRGYMGDSVFFKATSSFIQTNKFKDVTSGMLRDHFKQFTNEDLNAFFDQWVFNPGFPNFEILAIKSLESDNGFSNTLRIRQRLRFAPSFYTNVPMWLTAYDTNGDSVNVQMKLSGNETSVVFDSDFKPAFMVLDRMDLISDAVTSDQLWISANGDHKLRNGLMDVSVTVSGEPVLLRVEHHWVRPDDYFTNQKTPVLSRERYWRVDGIWPEGFEASARIYYDGRTPGQATGALDMNLIRQTEDSLVLMYREGPDMYWREYEFYKKVVGSPFDKYGYVTVEELKKGEYAFAMYDSDLLTTNTPVSKAERVPEIIPNPADDSVSISITDAKGGFLEITNSNGQLMHRIKINKQRFSFKYDVGELPAGIYYAGIVVENQPYNVKRFIVNR